MYFGPSASYYSNFFALRAFSPFCPSVVQDMVGNLDPGESEGGTHRILELLRVAIRTKCIEVFQSMMMIFRKVRYGVAGTVSVLLEADGVGSPWRGGP